MQGVNISEKTFGILAGFVKPWPGEKIDELGLISVLNTSGSKPPLLWVFNSQNEFVRLAEGLGHEQPLIGMRSLNTAVNMKKIISWDERILADHYASALKEYLGARVFFVGGNCQGAPIAGYLGSALLLSGARLQGFAAMEWADLPPLPVPVRLMFGEDSPMHNPFLKGLNPIPAWERMYPGHQVVILPGSHGTYFTPERLPNLVNALRDFVGAKADAESRDRTALQLFGLPKSCRVNQKLFVSALAPNGVGDDELMFLWDRHATALPHCGWERPTANDAGFSLRITAPGLPGLWTVQSYRCRAGEGPVSWEHDAQIYHQVEVGDHV